MSDSCAKRLSSVDAESPYDEVLHKIDDSILSVKLMKNKHRVEATDKHETESAPSIRVNCIDKYGNKCKKECPKVKVIHNQPPPPKEPDEEMLVLKTTQHITYANDMKHRLEVEFKSPRNYTPLPELGPPPPIIVPKKTIIVKPDKPGKKKNKSKAIKINIEQSLRAPFVNNILLE